MTTTAPVPAPLRPLGPLFAGRDAGRWTLPDDVLTLRAGLDRLLSTPEPEVVDEGSLHARLVSDTAAAAVRGEDVPDVAPLVDAARSREALTVHRRVIGGAIETLAGELHAQVADDPDAILVGHLRPAFDHLVGELRTAVATFTKYGATAGELLKAPDKARAAYLAVGDLSARWAALSAARSALASVGCVATADEASLFGLVRNAHAFTDMTRSRPVSKIADGLPWRSLSGSEWLLWFGTHHDADVWLPTPGEQDERYLEVFGDRIRSYQNSLTRGAMAHAM